MQNNLLQVWNTDTSNLTLTKNFLSKSIIEFAFAKYYSKNTPYETKEEIKYLCMGGMAGVTWAESYLARGFPDASTYRTSFYKDYDAALASGKYSRVHHAACGSGREAAYYAKKYPNIDFSGSDLDESIIRFCRENWNISNLKFYIVKLNRLNDIEKNALRSDLIVCSGGLQYIDEFHVKKFLSAAKFFTKKYYFTNQ